MRCLRSIVGWVSAATQSATWQKPGSARNPTPSASMLGYARFMFSGHHEGQNRANPTYGLLGRGTDHGAWRVVVAEQPPLAHWHAAAFAGPRARADASGVGRMLIFLNSTSPSSRARCRAPSAVHRRHGTFSPDRPPMQDPGPVVRREERCTASGMAGVLGRELRNILFARHLAFFPFSHREKVAKGRMRGGYGQPRVPHILYPTPPLIRRSRLGEAEASLRRSLVAAPSPRGRRGLRPFVFLLVGLLFFSAPALAVQPDEMLKNPALEARARVLSQNLRCLVCQNQSIDDSDASLAKDLRILLRERLTAGDTDARAMDFIVARYGNFVLLKPPFQANTALLWLGPGLLVLLAGFGFYRHIRQRQADPAPASFSAEDEARLAQLLKDGPKS